MRIHDEYRLQTILTLIQAGVIVFGSLFVGVILKATGYPDHFQKIPLILLFVRNWGFLLILIPLAWAMGSIWLERHFNGYSKRWSMVSGLCLLAALIWFLLKTLARAVSFF